MRARCRSDRATMDRSNPKIKRRRRFVPSLPTGAYESSLHEVFSLSRTLSVVGDQWSLQIVALTFMRFSRFGELRSALGITSAVLTGRIKTLIRHDVIKRIPDRAAPKGHEYILTQKGRDLYPVVMAMVRWADTHMDQAP
jgi:DNA-binding HxlR family transcriptional regulator